MAQLHVNVCANKDAFYTWSLPSVVLEKDLNKWPIVDYSQTLQEMNRNCASLQMNCSRDETSLNRKRPLQARHNNGLYLPVSVAMATAAGFACVPPHGSASHLKLQHSRNDGDDRRHAANSIPQWNDRQLWSINLWTWEVWLQHKGRFYITVPEIQIAQTQRLNPNNLHINKDYQPMFNKWTTKYQVRITLKKEVRFNLHLCR